MIVRSLASCYAIYVKLTSTMGNWILLGCVMLLLMYVSGIRLAYDRLVHLQPLVRIVASLLLAPFIHFASIVDNISIILKVVGVKNSRR